MINRVTRILTRWLNEHPTYGVSTLLAATAFDSAEEQTALLIGGQQLPLTIYNDVDDECVATRYDPDTVPALVIVAELTSEAPVKAGRAQLDYDTVAVSFAYMERDQPVRFSRQRCGYVLTAVQDSLLAFSNTRLSLVPLPDTVETWASASPTWRQLGDIEILEVGDTRESRLTGGVGKSTLIGTLLSTFKVRRKLAVRPS